NSYSSWSSIDAENRKLSLRISDNVDARCAVFSSNLNVRGYANLLFHRGIYEHKSIQETTELLAKRNACASVYLYGMKAFPGLPKYTKAIVTHKDGSFAVITNDGEVLQSLEVIDDSFYLTDTSWSHGVARRWAGFFVPNMKTFSDQYKTGRFVSFLNGEDREITGLITNGKYLNISLSGAPLDPEKVGLPSNFVVIDKVDHNPKEGKK
ncbi:MAG: hypothetical protein WAT12_14845, partial [Candidatus Nitrotoga sp.]